MQKPCLVLLAKTAPDLPRAASETEIIIEEDLGKPDFRRFRRAATFSSVAGVCRDVPQ